MKWLLISAFGRACCHGGIHATMCLNEVMEHVDSVVTGEAESVWAKLLEDAGMAA